MGTNYYWYRLEACPRCGRSDEPVHIGKSSAGWEFYFHGTDDIRSWRDWKEALAGGGEIRDEYGRVLTLEEFRWKVEERSHPNGLLNHYDECARTESRDYMATQWKDEEGYSFSSGEFC